MKNVKNAVLGTFWTVFRRATPLKLPLKLYTDAYGASRKTLELVGRKVIS